MPATTPWVSISLDDAKACVLAELVNLVFSRATKAKQADPFLTVAPKVIARVRNKVASNANNRLSPDPSLVPPELAEQTALLIAHAMVLPLTGQSGAEINEDMRKAIAQAQKDLDDAAANRFAVSLPPDAESPGLGVSSTAGTIALVTGNRRQATRERMRGL